MLKDTEMNSSNSASNIENTNDMFKVNFEVDEDVAEVLNEYRKLYGENGVCELINNLLDDFFKTMNNEKN
ncbi:hypothetical protein [Neobacillus mesonae]|uniref:hypothetical protein n=1 Tax=Neobacillus mesonae TaxID=1193713 RepID=UPI000831421F|nr:hypothetical protein [Neobacillus mesonae]